jgi:serine protease Do
MSLSDNVGSKKSWWAVAAIPLVLAALAMASPTPSAPKDVDHDAAVAVSDAQSLSKAFRGAAKIAQPSVVMIQKSAAMPASAKGPAPSAPDIFKGSPFGKQFREMPELRRFFEQLPEMPRQQPGGIGSGVIYDASGLILTNHHVVSGGGKVTVRLQDGREFEAVEVKSDPKTDVAVVRIENAENLTAMKLGDSDRMDIGDWVLALGQPFGLEGTVTAGIVSAKSRGIGITDREEFIQTDAAINPGNSGGPLVNLAGEVIGINTAISSRTGGNQGVGFAIPINLAKWVADQLVSDGAVRRAYLGVVIQPVTHELAKQFDVKARQGVLVSEVQADSPAEKAGVKPGDVIVEFDGKTISSPRELQSLVERSAASERHPLTIVRDGQQVILKVTCDVRSEDEVVPSSEGPEVGKLGLELSNLTPDVAEKLGVKGMEGVVITSVQPNGPAAKAGLSTGDVIVQVNRKPVRSVEDVTKAMQEEDNEQGTLLLVRSERGSRFVVIHPAS